MVCAKKDIFYMGGRIFNLGNCLCNTFHFGIIFASWIRMIILHVDSEPIRSLPLCGSVSTLPLRGIQAEAVSTVSVIFSSNEPASAPY